MSFHAKYKGLFKGNFFIDDFAKFKQVTADVLESMQQYLNSLLTSIKNKFLFIKNEGNLIEYIR